MIFHIYIYIGNIIIPTDELIFFRRVAQPPTSEYMFNDKCIPGLQCESIYYSLNHLLWIPMLQILLQTLAARTREKSRTSTCSHVTRLQNHLEQHDQVQHLGTASTIAKDCLVQ